MLIYTAIETIFEFFCMPKNQTYPSELTVRWGMSGFAPVYLPFTFGKTGHQECCGSPRAAAHKEDDRRGGRFHLPCPRMHYDLPQNLVCCTQAACLAERRNAGKACPIPPSELFRPQMALGTAPATDDLQNVLHFFCI